VNCDAIWQANAAWEVCSTGPTTCAGVFTDGAGCQAYCAAAGLVCTARYGGEPGCQLESSNVHDCNVNNGHQSDWCECGPGSGGGSPPPVGGGGGSPPVGGDCQSDPANPPLLLEQNFSAATFSPRSNWVLGCYPYAYTAAGAEHEDCDPGYSSGSDRRGTATFTFHNVPRGRYDAFMGGRHTLNRNGAGAVFIVNGHSVTINQRVHAPDMRWDLHGNWCLEGTVTVVLDSTVNSGSDSVSGVRLEPAP